jgi:hypothetical protein
MENLILIRRVCPAYQAFSSPAVHDERAEPLPILLKGFSRFARRSNAFFLDAARWIASLALAMTALRRALHLQPSPPDGGRSNIPETPMMEWRSRSVLDTPLEPVIGSPKARPGGRVDGFSWDSASTPLLNLQNAHAQCEEQLPT